MPARLMRPGVTRTPTRPQKLDGSRMEPPVSPPMPTTARPAAMAAAVPLDEPPGSRVRSCGLAVVVESEEVENQEVAQSGMVDLARMSAPAALRRRTRVASAVGV